MADKRDDKVATEKPPSLDEKTSSLDVEEGSKYIDGSEGVTQHEFETLRHVSDKFPLTAWLVVIVEFAERWTYYGTANIFNNYIREGLPRGSTNGAVVFEQDRDGGIAGALGRGQTVSFAIRTFNTFFVYITPFLGAIIADTMWGRYKTIMVFSLVCLLGHIVLVIGATPPVIANNDAALAVLILSILIIAIGAGSIKSNVSPMIAEQYTGKLRKKTLKSGETVLISPHVTIQSTYLWFYAAINLGASGAISASFLARDHGFWVAWLVPTIIFLLVPGVLLLGKKKYVVTPPRGSILLETIRVIRLAMTPAWSLNPVQTIRNIRAPGFWENAKPSHYPPGQVPKSITWDDEFVGEVARTCNACGVFLFFPFFWLCYSQIDGNLSTTAAGMTLNGTPNDLIQNLNPIGIIIMVPIFDRIIYPFLRRRGIDFTPIKRIYVGFLVAGLAMVYAAVLQSFLNKRSPCDNNQPSACKRPADDGNGMVPDPADINVWVVVGPYLMVGMAEIFASITSLEYAFTKAPARMKSVVMAFAQFQTAVSAAINFALTAANAEENFVWLYGSFAITAWVIGTIFFFTFRQLDRNEHKLNAIGKGERAGFADERPDTAEKS
ncbi:peptide transporter PTR2B [Coprinopsis cinerea okayama7|uniref:Peptide transporter PTR2B n=1 Tax=Coprinopsis cinerea (strain Okayama-7 / 130 / ATCC MYA-4618 / FGSC 9003) TaxID=240176 RepID=A8PI77_COPC7|nr:peptide transporter PTR2B [Coprinopsis cinerea okayama7\|eukprot:XP_001841529.1 peptide transporter PTR2B [Coprinopsis cinerea okayama7\